jgi:hypothetical protein
MTRSAAVLRHERHWRLTLVDFGQYPAHPITTDAADIVRYRCYGSLISPVRVHRTAEKSLAPTSWPRLLIAYANVSASPVRPGSCVADPFWNRVARVTPARMLTPAACERSLMLNAREKGKVGNEPSSRIAPFSQMNARSTPCEILLLVPTIWPC